MKNFLDNTNFNLIKGFQCNFFDLLEYFSNLFLILFPKFLSSSFDKFDFSIYLTVFNSYYLNFLIYCLLNSTFFKYNQMIDYTLINYLNIKKNKLVIHLLSLFLNMRLSLNFFINEFEVILSLTGFFQSANWAEREIFDMFGVYFLDHPDLRRILTDYGFLNYPLKKDFPLVGYNELFYSDILKNLEFYSSCLKISLK